MARKLLQIMIRWNLWLVIFLLRMHAEVEASSSAFQENDLLATECTYVYYKPESFGVDLIPKVKIKAFFFALQPTFKMCLLLFSYTRQEAKQVHLCLTKSLRIMKREQSDTKLHHLVSWSLLQREW